MTTRARINIRTAVNASKITKEKRDGRDKIIVPSATLPDDVIMNEIQYPAAEIAKSFMTLDRTPAPLGHPLVNGRFISASDPEGINIGWVGAHNENVRRKDGRVFLDKVIDVARANESENGRKLLKAIEKKEPIHTSTGLYLDLEDTDEVEGAKYIARNMVFDHDAILLGEDGAATPDQGVGIFVNSQGDDEEILVVNSALEEADRELDWAGMRLISALERRDTASRWERLKSAIMEAVSGSERGTSTTEEQENDMADSKQLDDLTAKVNKLETSFEELGKSIGTQMVNAVTEAMKPVKDHMDQIAANQKADEEAKRAAATNALVKGGKWTEEDLKDMPLAALNRLVEREAPKKAQGLNSAYTPGNDEGDPFKGYDMNSHIDGDKQKAQA